MQLLNTAVSDHELIYSRTLGRFDSRMVSTVFLARFQRGTSVVLWMVNQKCFYSWDILLPKLYAFNKFWQCESCNRLQFWFFPNIWGTHLPLVTCRKTTTSNNLQETLVSITLYVNTTSTAICLRSSGVFWREPFQFALLTVLRNTWETMLLYCFLEYYALLARTVIQLNSFKQNILG